MTTTLYETDFNLWIEQTVNQLKNGQIQDLDLENLIEEIQSMGSNDKREIKSRLIVLIMHLLKYKYQPKKKTKSWISTITTQRDELELVLENSPSLKPFLKANISECYQKARKNAARETKLPLTTFPFFIILYFFHLLLILNNFLLYCGD
ncbi:MAG: DUF29 domain-containing protein [Woronichinia naegeliana WA131]|jgi:hypothetical protein|uniref:DUF29 domain-containing protein n=1 Tax=Woronichinia naegeliana WA131 TaxID=2824559 RepID=A0A977KZU0_9CYAN|nr:MAG: DUF29 domain-containing protein [Woronichinia naegeliana WA131]